MDDYLFQQGLQLQPDTACIRRLCTTRALLAGDMAFASNPLATALLANERMQRCHSCFQTIISSIDNDDDGTREQHRRGSSISSNPITSSLMTCGGCRHAIYCDTTCQRMAWPRHRFECRFRQQQASSSSAMPHPGDDPELLLLLRTYHLLHASHLPEVVDCEREIYRSLPHHRPQHTAWSLDRYGQLADTLLAMAPFPSSASFTRMALIEEQCRFGCNNFTIVNDQHHPIGVGVYPMASLLNHSCRPNCTYRFDGTQLQVVALQPIHAGEELTISYIDWIHGPVERVSQLERQYFFQCRCPRCLDGEHDDPLDRLLRHNLSTITTPVDIADWVAGQMVLTDGLLAQTTQHIVDALLLDSPDLSDDAFVECQTKWYATLNEADSAIGPMFSRAILEAVGGFMNEQLAEGHWAEAAEASRYRLAVYLLVYGRYHPLVPLELLTLASCLWNRATMDASRHVVGLLQAMPALMARTHPSAERHCTPLYRQYKELMEKARRESMALTF